MKDDMHHSSSVCNRCDHRATSPEALIGHINLTSSEDRIAELMRRALPEEYAEEPHEE